MKELLLLAASSAIVLAAPALAQSTDHPHRPGMTMPSAPPPAQTAPSRLAPAGDSSCLPEHAAMGHCTPAAASETANPRAEDPAPKPATSDCSPEHAAMGHCTQGNAADPHAGHAMPGMTAGSVGGTALPAGNAPAPAPPEATYADRIWGRDAMVDARGDLRRDHGGGTFSQIMIDLAEVHVRDGDESFEWDAEGWFGGDINRVVLKSEGSGAFSEDVEEAEVQALYSRAIGPYFNLQAGVRHDFAPHPSRSYATIGFEGLAPYWFDVEGALFLSDQGDVLGRIEGYYDQRITQRLILQPRAELNLAAQDVPENGIGSGVSDIELGVRLRYEIAREFAPYVGVSWDRKLGDTAEFARIAGEDPSSASLVLGIRAWF